MNLKAKQKPALEQDTGDSITNRILGVYPQKQDGLFMQRIKIFGGRINWAQWRRIAQLAASYTPSSKLHVTTRQSIELHDIAGRDVPVIQQGLSEVALLLFGAGGNSLRNITVCSGCDFDTESADVFPLARFVDQHLSSKSNILDLPRKFKISFSGCERACAKPWLNDLGFIAQQDGIFTVIGAGSLGAKPALGIELYKDLAARDVTPLCVGAIEFFEQYGDREDRRRARFRHVREKLGEPAFRAELDKWFSNAKARRSWPEISTTTTNKNTKLLWRLQLPNGNIKAEQAILLADAAEPQGAELRINLEHGLELYGKKTVELPKTLAAFENNPIVVTCPGSTTCPHAVANTRQIADSIRTALADLYHPDVRINISGCPNNCAQSSISGLGLVGVLRKQNGKATQCCRLFTGGGNGRNDKLARETGILNVQDIPNTIKQLVKRQER
ncbi:MAG TPA: nitrite/sulfite reductase [Sedimentisphaerales bacterium]|nr:nitrite/sulfite reductase [Sedimentisphaerales bacterium]